MPSTAAPPAPDSAAIRASISASWPLLFSAERSAAAIAAASLPASSCAALAAPASVPSLPEISAAAASTSAIPDWAWASENAARDVADGRAEQGIVACWTGTGAAIAANKVAGIRAALCADATTADGARRWNDANVLALSLRLTSRAALDEILDAWFAGGASEDPVDQANVAHLSDIERGPTAAS